MQSYILRKPLSVVYSEGVLKKAESKTGINKETTSGQIYGFHEESYFGICREIHGLEEYFEYLKMIDEELNKD